MMTHNIMHIKTINFTTDKVVGSGSFGIVFQAQINNEIVAIKKVLQDRQFKNRELQVMKLLNHPNCIKMKYFFYSTDGTNTASTKTFLNIVMDYVPQTIYSVCRYFTKQKKYIPHFYIKLYAYQLCRSITYIHGMGISHRDIKPQNVLVDAASGVVRLCDFGSAKVLKPSEQSVAYICSRYYRAPELIFGATVYTCAIDVWSVGCVIAEMLMGQPIFPGESSIDQLMEIIKVIGKPSHSDIVAMNPMQYGPNASNRPRQSSSQQMPPSVDGVLTSLPDVKPAGLAKTLPAHVDRHAIDLLQRMLTYNPVKRIKAIECLAHPYFNSLSDVTMKMPDGRDMPPLFNFTQDELYSNPDFFTQLMQQHNGPNYNPVTNSTGSAPFQMAVAGAGTSTGEGGGGPAGSRNSTPGSSSNSRSSINTPTAAQAQRTSSRAGTGGSTTRNKLQLPQLQVQSGQQQAVVGQQMQGQGTQMQVQQGQVQQQGQHQGQGQVQGQQQQGQVQVGTFPAQFPSAASSTSLQQGSNAPAHTITRIGSQQSTSSHQSVNTGTATGTGIAYLPPLSGTDPRGQQYLAASNSADLRKYAALPPIPPFRRNKNVSNTSNNQQQDGSSENK